MDQTFGPKKAEPFFLYFTAQEARILFLMDNKPASLSLIFDGTHWKVQSLPQ